MPLGRSLSSLYIQPSRPCVPPLVIDFMLNRKWTKLALGGLWKARRVLFWTMLVPGPKLRVAHNRPKIDLERQRPCAIIDKIVFFVVLLLLWAQHAANSPKDPLIPPKDLPKTSYGGPFPCFSSPKNGQERTQADFDTIFVDFRTTIKTTLSFYRAPR